MGEERWPLARLFAEVAVGSCEHAWTDEIAWCWENEPDYMAALVGAIERDGQRKPVMIGDDDRLWDGHHRVAAADRLGRDVLVVRYTDLSEQEQMNHMIDAIGDLEDRPLLTPALRSMEAQS